MNRRKITNPLALAVLACLFERPMHPYEISSTLKYRNKEESIRLNYGSLYSVVQSLMRAGFIEILETAREGNRPERTIYAITDAGRTELHIWLSELMSVPQKEYPAFEAALSLLAVLRPDEALNLIEQRIERIDQRLAQIGEANRQMSDEALPELFRIESDFQQAMLEAERAFVVQMAGKIRSGTLGGIRTWRCMHDLIDGNVTVAEVRADPERFIGNEGGWWFDEMLESREQR